MTPPAKRKLPSGLACNTDGTYKFVRINAKRSLQNAMGYDESVFLEVLPCSALVRDLEYAVYAHETGFLLGLPMNVMVNPFCNSCDLVYMARFGGPHGNMVLHCERGSLSREHLLTMCRRFDDDAGDDDDDDHDDEDDDEEPYRPYTEAMIKALDEWDSQEVGATLCSSNPMGSSSGKRLHDHADEEDEPPAKRAKTESGK